MPLALLRSMGTFQWFGDIYPFPPGVEGLSVEHWYMRLARIQERLTEVDRLDIPEMLDANGDELHPAEVLIIREFGFLSWGQLEAFVDWSHYSWAHHLGEDRGHLRARMTAMCQETLARERGAAVSSGSAVVEDSAPFEAFVQVQEAVNAAQLRGADGARVLAEFGLTLTDFGNLGAYWNNKMQAETTTYHQLYSVYSTKYRAMYGGA